MDTMKLNYQPTAFHDRMSNLDNSHVFGQNDDKQSCPNSVAASMDCLSQYKSASTPLLAGTSASLLNNTYGLSPLPSWVDLPDSRLCSSPSNSNPSSTGIATLHRTLPHPHSNDASTSRNLESTDVAILADEFLDYSAGANTSPFKNPRSNKASQSNSLQHKITEQDRFVLPNRMTNLDNECTSTISLGNVPDNALHRSELSQSKPEQSPVPTDCLVQATGNSSGDLHLPHGDHAAEAIINANNSQFSFVVPNENASKSSNSERLESPFAAAKPIEERACPQVFARNSALGSTPLPCASNEQLEEFPAASTRKTSDRIGCAREDTSLLGMVQSCTLREDQNSITPSPLDHSNSKPHSQRQRECGPNLFKHQPHLAPSIGLAATGSSPAPAIGNSNSQPQPSGIAETNSKSATLKGNHSSNNAVPPEAASPSCQGPSMGSGAAAYHYVQAAYAAAMHPHHAHSTMAMFPYLYRPMHGVSSAAAAPLPLPGSVPYSSMAAAAAALQGQLMYYGMQCSPPPASSAPPATSQTRKLPPVLTSSHSSKWQRATAKLTSSKVSEGASTGQSSFATLSHTTANPNFDIGSRYYPGTSHPSSLAVGSSLVPSSTHPYTSALAYRHSQVTSRYFGASSGTACSRIPPSRLHPLHLFGAKFGLPDFERAGNYLEHCEITPVRAASAPPPAMPKYSHVGTVVASNANTKVLMPVGMAHAAMSEALTKEVLSNAMGSKRQSSNKQHLGRHAGNYDDSSKELTDKSGSPSSHLPEHIVVRHPNMEMIKAPAAPRRYACGMCGKTFSRPSSLQTHFYTHTGEKPFLCEHKNCGKRFSVLSNLRRHQKIHSKDDCGIASYENSESCSVAVSGCATPVFVPGNVAFYGDGGDEASRHHAMVNYPPDASGKLAQSPHGNMTLNRIEDYSHDAGEAAEVDQTDDDLLPPITALPTARLQEQLKRRTSEGQAFAALQSTPSLDNNSDTISKPNDLSMSKRKSITKAPSSASSKSNSPDSHASISLTPRTKNISAGCKRPSDAGLTESGPSGPPRRRRRALSTSVPGPQKPRLIAPAPNPPNPLPIVSLLKPLTTKSPGSRKRGHTPLLDSKDIISPKSRRIKSVTSPAQITLYAEDSGTADGMNESSYHHNSPLRNSNSGLANLQHEQSANDKISPQPVSPASPSVCGATAAVATLLAAAAATSDNLRATSAGNGRKKRRASLGAITTKSPIRLRSRSASYINSAGAVSEGFGCDPTDSAFTESHTTTRAASVEVPFSPPIALFEGRRTRSVSPTVNATGAGIGTPLDLLLQAAAAVSKSRASQSRSLADIEDGDYSEANSTASGLTSATSSERKRGSTSSWTPRHIPVPLSLSNMHEYSSAAEIGMAPSSAAMLHSTCSVPPSPTPASPLTICAVGDGGSAAVCFNTFATRHSGYISPKVGGMVRDHYSPLPSLAQISAAALTDTDKHEMQSIQSDKVRQTNRLSRTKGEELTDRAGRTECRKDVERDRPHDKYGANGPAAVIPQGAATRQRSARASLSLR